MTAEPVSPSPAPARGPSRRARWAVPVAVGAVVAGAFAAPSLVASAGSDLPELTPAELLARVAEADRVPLSGTVVHTARLGLPDLPLEELQGASPLDLLGGSSTVRLWTDGEDRSRAALLGDLSEYSVVRDGPEAWTYSSRDDEVVHYTVSPDDLAAYSELDEAARSGTAPDVAGDLPTPAQAADALLAYAALSTDVSVGSATEVAGRDSYQLGLVPRTHGTLVERVLVAVDAETSTPLRVQVWSTQDAQTPALEIGFTDVSFATPDDAVFDFSAPAGAATREVEVPLPEPADRSAAGPEALTGAPEGVSVHGSGWETVVAVEGVDVAGLLAGDPASASALPGLERSFGSAGAQDLYGELVGEDGTGPALPEIDAAALYEQLTEEVPEGRLLSSALLSVLVTDDGRVLAGAVPAEVLRDLA
ncbi:LolA family protein [Cellulosimicrobium marinum]|uniref:LolA family protein n=1 Tax=Cellulosimicrobium marinum TaxID=1638992 RepID=UPI001E37018A|nr:hypothetical protein [Cellulosimicrobium marinum]MCB7137327.1 hypothetical protein [Cellulosimicrobium marinum]